MKKTIIALMAMVGMVGAAEESITLSGTTAADFNTSLAAALETLEYAKGTAYELTFSVGNVMSVNDNNNTGGALFTLGDNYYIICQEGKYAAINTTASNKELGAATPSSSTASPAVHNFSGTFGSFTGWVSLNSSKTTKDVNYPIVDTTFTITYNGTDSIITMDFAGSAYDAVIKYAGYEIDATKLAAGVNQGNISGTFKTIPEPTTATLSLLALAGLAARRRRK